VHHVHVLSRLKAVEESHIVVSSDPLKTLSKFPGSSLRVPIRLIEPIYDSLIQNKFFDYEKAIEGDLTLLLNSVTSALGTPTYRYDIVLQRKGKTGEISLTLSNDCEVLLYKGHIRFFIEQKFRGNKLSARACKLLLPLAKMHQFKAIWLVSPTSDLAARKVCENVGAKLIETIPNRDNLGGFNWITRFKLVL